MCGCYVSIRDRAKIRVKYRVRNRAREWLLVKLIIYSLITVLPVVTSTYLLKQKIRRMI